MPSLISTLGIVAEGRSARGTPVVGDSSTGGESRLRRSWWSVHASELGLPENLVGKS